MNQPQRGHPHPRLSADAAQSFVDVLKANAQMAGVALYDFNPNQTLRCTWVPDMSYGRYHEPVRGNEQFQWTWEVWTRDGAVAAGKHLEPKKRGWVGLSHEGYALRLLAGEPWADVKASMFEAGLALAKVFS